MLKKEFLEESHKQGCWISEAQYEWTSNDISAGSPKIPLYEAPRKWRTVLQNNGGAFKKWNVIVHMNDNKMKKAYERYQYYCFWHYQKLFKLNIIAVVFNFKIKIIHMVSNFI